MLFNKDTSKGKKAAFILGLVAVAAVFILVYVFFGKELVGFISDTESMRAWLDSFGIWAEVVFVALRTLQTVAKIIPAQPLEIGSGYVFGIWGGVLWCMVGTVIGSLIILLLSKLFGEKFIKLFVPEEKQDKFLFLKNSKNIYIILFFIYLIPAAPKDLITYFAWLLPVKIPAFLLVTGVARIPAILVSTICGAALGEENYSAAVLIFVLTLVLSVAGIFIYRKIENKHK